MIQPANNSSVLAECRLVPLGRNLYQAVSRPLDREICIQEAVRLTGLSRDTVYRLFRAGLVTGRRPSPRKIVLSTRSLHQHLTATQDQEFWTQERRRAFYQQQNPKPSGT